MSPSRGVGASRRFGVRLKVARATARAAEKSDAVRRTGDFGEFDPGSGRTLAACLTHASRAGQCLEQSGCWLAANG